MGHIVPREVCIILLLSATSGIRVGDIIIQLVFFLVLIALVVGIGFEPKDILLSYLLKVR